MQTDSHYSNHDDNGAKRPADGLFTKTGASFLLPFAAITAAKGSRKLAPVLVKSPSAGLFAPLSSLFE